MRSPPGGLFCSPFLKFRRPLPCAIVPIPPNHAGYIRSIDEHKPAQPPLRFPPLFSATSTVCLATETTPTPAPTLEIPAAARPAPDFSASRRPPMLLARQPFRPTRKRARMPTSRADTGCNCGTSWSWQRSCCFCCRLASPPRIRDWAEKFTCACKNLQTLLYFIPFFLLVPARFNFLFAVVRGICTASINTGSRAQTFGPWLRDQIVGLAVGIVLVAIAIMILFAIVRRLGARWWVWGAIASVLLLGVHGPDRSRLHRPAL